MTCSVCAERPARYKSTGECSRCYNRRYVSENREAVRARALAAQRIQRARSEDRTDEMPIFDLTAPIAYSTAHTRVAYWRGRAATHACSCGQQAREWSYRGGSEFEQTATIPRFRSRGEAVAAYSPDPRDYAPLCRSCHVTHDLAQAKTFSAARG